MKKLIFAVALACTLNATHAQKIYAWMDAGAKVGYGLSGLINSNLFKDRDYEHHISTGLGYGAKLGLFFGLYNGITADFLISNYNQEFDYNRDGKNYITNTKWKTFDISLLYRSQKDGLYVEIGPQYSILNKVEHADNFPGAATGDQSNNYVKNYWAAVFGVGGYVFNYETFTTMLGIRLGYGLNDMVTAEGKALGYPAPSQHFPPSSTDRPFAKDKSTNPAWVQLVLEANFALGYYGRTSCSKRATLFSF